MEVVVKGIYRHYKGNLYLVEEVAKHSETLEDMVVYRALYGDRTVWVRPLWMFVEEVEGKDQTHRFELVKIKDATGRH